MTIESSSTNAKFTDDSFEGESSSMPFQANCAFAFEVGPGMPGWVKATISPMGAGGANNKNSEILLSVVAIPAD